MTRIIPLLASALGILVTHTALAADAVAVAVGRVTVVRSAQAIATVAVGDPSIADVVAEGNNAILVFGKKSGQTDLVLLDGQHRLLRKSSILVSPTGGDDTIIVRRPGNDGIAAEAWVCVPSCAKVIQK